jgi:ribosome-interacting GTPase 1
MPANLTPQYLEAEERYRQAKDPEQKLKALREMWALLPKHKGTDKLQADIKKRMSKLKAEAKRQKSAKRQYEFSVEREGAAQVLLLGAPNCGKSQLLASVTRAKPDIGEYPFTTHKPMPGMMPFEDIQIQLVDCAPVSADYMEHWVTGLFQAADAVALVFDCSLQDPQKQIDEVLARLSDAKLFLRGLTSESPAEPRVKDNVLVGNKVDLARIDTVKSLKQRYGERLFLVSALKDENLEQFKRGLFECLSLVRVYTKVPGKKPDLQKPYVLREGSSVLDLATTIHREVADSLRFARIWGSDKYDGQPVQRDHVLQDKDIIEIHQK